MWFRVLLAACTTLFVALLGRMSAHVSLHARVLGRYSVPYFLLLLAVAGLSLASVLAHLPGFYGRLLRARWSCVVGLLSAVVLLVAAEIAVRVFDPLGISYIEESSRLWSDYVPDSDLVFRLPPHMQGLYQGVTISTNALGLRDREVERKQNGELRILLLGDSITFGYGVPAEETFGRRLESILTARLGRKVTTVNAGMGGFNTVQEYALLERYVSTFDPDVVTLLYIPNDIDVNDPPFNPRSNPALPGNAQSTTSRILQKSWLYKLANFALSNSQPGRPSELDAGSRGVKESLKALANIATLCRRRGFTFDTFFYRDDDQFGAPFIDELFSAVSAVGSENGFVVTNVQPWLGTKERRSVTNSVVDWHPNPRGHDILATEMANVLLNSCSLTQPRPLITSR
jgi:lysophospholipase L1-like esterase